MATKKACTYLLRKDSEKPALASTHILVLESVEMRLDQWIVAGICHVYDHTSAPITEDAPYDHLSLVSYPKS